MKATMKKATQVALATALLSGAWATTASAKGITFSDLSSTNYLYNNIYELVDRGVLTGYPNGTFLPAKSLTRAEAAKILTEALDLDTTNVVDPGFSDVKKSNWFYEEVAILAELEIINGYSKQKFGPHDILTRAQMAKILSAAYNLYIPHAVDMPFTDLSEAAWYYTDVENLYHYNVTKGISPTKYGPNDPVRRDTMATFIINSESVLEEQKSEDWMPVWVEMYNDDVTNPMKVTVDTKLNEITVSIAPTAKMVEEIIDTDLFYFILPIYEVQATYIKGTDINLTELSFGTAYTEIMNALDVDAETDLNDLAGKSITLTFEGINEEIFEYTVTFINN